MKVYTKEELEEQKGIYYGLEKMGKEKKYRAEKKNVCFGCEEKPRVYPKENPQFCASCFLQIFFVSDINKIICDLQSLKTKMKFNAVFYADLLEKDQGKELIEKIKKSNKKWEDLGKFFMNN